MRRMTSKEIDLVLKQVKWATICTISPENLPYAIEATPYLENSDICFMVNPRGQTWKNLQINPSILIKATLADSFLAWWAGVSFAGAGHFDSNREAIQRGFQLLGKVTGSDYSAAGRKHAENAERSPLLRVSIREKTGRCSLAKNESLYGRINIRITDER